jgi:hypothetical protein
MAKGGFSFPARLLKIAIIELAAGVPRDQGAGAVGIRNAASAKIY